MGSENKADQACDLLASEPCFGLFDMGTAPQALVDNFTRETRIHSIDAMSPPETAPLSSLLPSPEPAAALPRAARDLDGVAFDVCHGALALRALLVINSVVVLGTLLAHDTWAQAVAALGPALAVSLPATLLWLGLVCALRRVIAPLAPAWRLTVLAALGALLAWAAAWPLAALGLIEPSPLRAWALPLAGAATTLPLAWWLQSREQARTPADAGARLAELQSRIRPHFLFNTLNTAISLVRSDPERAEGVLEDLAELFRVALKDHGSGGTVTLADEIDLAQRYLAIEELRFGERLAVRWELDPAANPARLPPLALQPLLENAVRHGIEPAESGGRILVRTRSTLGRAEVVIDNSLPDAGARTNPGHGVALDNVRSRLRLLHDLDAQFEAGRYGDGWRVRLVVPLGGTR
jgi:two-component system sensor histidine kinase AlgZ